MYTSSNVEIFKLISFFYIDFHNKHLKSDIADLNSIFLNMMFVDGRNNLRNLIERSTETNNKSRYSFVFYRPDYVGQDKCMAGGDQHICPIIIRNAYMENGIYNKPGLICVDSRGVDYLEALSKKDSYFKLIQETSPYIKEKYEDEKYFLYSFDEDFKKLIIKNVICRNSCIFLLQKFINTDEDLMEQYTDISNFNCNEIFKFIDDNYAKLNKFISCDESGRDAYINFIGELGKNDEFFKRKYISLLFIRNNGIYNQFFSLNQELKVLFVNKYIDTDLYSSLFIRGRSHLGGKKGEELLEFYNKLKKDFVISKGIDERLLDAYNLKELYNLSEEETDYIDILQYISKNLPIFMKNESLLEDTGMYDSEFHLKFDGFSCEVDRQYSNSGCVQDAFDILTTFALNIKALNSKLKDIYDIDKDEFAVLMLPFTERFNASRNLIQKIKLQEIKDESCFKYLFRSGIIFDLENFVSIYKHPDSIAGFESLQSSQECVESGYKISEKQEFTSYCSNLEFMSSMGALRQREQDKKDISFINFETRKRNYENIISIAFFKYEEKDDRIIQNLLDKKQSFAIYLYILEHILSSQKNLGDVVLKFTELLKGKVQKDLKEEHEGFYDESSCNVSDCTGDIESCSFFNSSFRDSFLKKLYNAEISIGFIRIGEKVSESLSFIENITNMEGDIDCSAEFEPIKAPFPSFNSSVFFNVKNDSSSSFDIAEERLECGQKIEFLDDVLFEQLSKDIRAKSCGFVSKIDKSTKKLFSDKNVSIAERGSSVISNEFALI